VALLAGELGADEGLHEFLGHIAPHDASTQAQHVCVIVLDTLMGRIRVVGDHRPHPRDLVGGDAGSGARPTDDDPTVGATVRHRPAHRLGEVGVVDRRLVVGAEVDDGVLPL
jgi:hypothetical protein